jgi:hypothetical protein
LIFLRARVVGTSATSWRYVKLNAAGKGYSKTHNQNIGKHETRLHVWHVLVTRWIFVKKSRCWFSGATKKTSNAKKIGEVGLAEPEYPATAKDNYRKIYYEALNLMISGITNRFDQNDYKVYTQCERLLLQAAAGENFEEALDHVKSFYGADFDYAQLHADIYTFRANADISDHTITFSHILKYFRSFSCDQQCLMPQLKKLITLILVMPATNATSERSFSCLRRVKTYLRTTMTQKRLNHMMMLHTHISWVDKLDLIQIANLFVNNEHRSKMFGFFTGADLQNLK